MQGTCHLRGGEGVSILKKYAENQFAELKSSLEDKASSSEGHSRVKHDVNIYHSVIALAGAYHADGPVAANELRDRFIDYCKDHLDEARVAAIEKDFAKNMERARHRRENLIREKRPDNKRNSRAAGIDADTPDTDSEPSSRGNKSTVWFWPGLAIAAAFLGLGCWKLIRRL